MPITDYIDVKRDVSLVDTKWFVESMDAESVAQNTVYSENDIRMRMHQALTLSS